MGNYENLKQSITEVIRTNGNQEITGAVLQSTLLTIISTVGANATFAGIATPTTNPGTPDQNVFYLASEAGTYTNFGGVELQGGLSVLMLNGSSWSSQQMLSIDDVPTAGSNNLVKSGGVQEELALGAVYDVSAKNPTAGVNNDGKFESLSALLEDANLDTLIPTGARKGGMSIKFIQSSDNKYVQYRLMSNSFDTNVANWQGVDDEPTAGSENLVKSEGIYDYTNKGLSKLFPQIISVTKEWSASVGPNTYLTSFYVEAGKKYYIRKLRNTGAGNEVKLFINPDYSYILFMYATNIYYEAIFNSSGYISIVYNPPSSPETATIDLEVYNEEEYEKYESSKSEINELKDFVLDETISINKTWADTNEDRWYQSSIAVKSGEKYIIEVLSYNGASKDVIMHATAGTHHEDICNLSVGYKTLYSPNNDASLIFYVKPNQSEVATLVVRVKKYHNEEVINDIAIVSNTGNDSSGIGSMIFPYATVTEAIKHSNTIIVRGGYYTETLTVSNQTKRKRIVAYNNERPLFFLGEILVNQETPTSGYTKVYQCDYPSDPGTKYIYQYDIEDSNMIINQEDRHALHRRWNSRADCTRINRVSSINDIENSDEYAYYWNNNVLYFSRPQTVSATNYLFAPTERKWIFSSNKNPIMVEGIYIYGGNIRVQYSDNFYAKECVVRYTKESAFYITRSKCIELVECEAAFAEGLSLDPINGIFGDGIGLDYGESVIADNDDYYAFKTTSHLRDCWCHDNYNDGFSDHQGCNSQVDGGLFEYNCIHHGGGITPSLGSSMLIRNAVCQYNYDDGIRYTNSGSGAQLIPYGTMICQNVISRGNTNNGINIIDHYDNAELINCIIYNNGKYGLSNLYSNSIMKSINSKIFNNTLGDSEGNINIVV